MGSERARRRGEETAAVRVPVQVLDRDPHFGPFLRVPCKFLDRDPQWGQAGRVGKREGKGERGRGTGKRWMGKDGWKRWRDLGWGGVLGMWGKLRIFAKAMCRDKAAIAERQ